MPVTIASLSAWDILGCGLYINSVGMLSLIKLERPAQALGYFSSLTSEQGTFVRDSGTSSRRLRESGGVSGGAKVKGISNISHSDSRSQGSWKDSSSRLKSNTYPARVGLKALKRHLSPIIPQAPQRSSQEAPVPNGAKRHKRNSLGKSSADKNLGSPELPTEESLRAEVPAIEADSGGQSSAEGRKPHLRE